MLQLIEYFGTTSLFFVKSRRTATTEAGEASVREPVIRLAVRVLGNPRLSTRGSTDPSVLQPCRAQRAVIAAELSPEDRTQH